MFSAGGELTVKAPTENAERLAIRELLCCRVNALSVKSTPGEMAPTSINLVSSAVKYES